MPVPMLLVTGLVSVALPALTQGEVKLTDIGTVAAVGGVPISTGTLTLLVP